VTAAFPRATRNRTIAAGFAACLAAGEAAAGAPFEGGRFVNPENPHIQAGPAVTLPFFLRKFWTSAVSRPGAAPRVPFDRSILAGTNPTVTWIGHATMLVRMGGMAFLTDPMFSEYASPLPLLGPSRLQPPGASLDEIGRVDFVTLSHNHYDHSDLPSIRALAARGVRFVVPLGLGALVRSAGGEATELDWWQSVSIGALTVHCVPAQHFSRRGVTDGDATLWAGWVVEDGTRRFYHAGDTGYFAGFAEIGRRFGPIDLAALPIGAYEPAAMMHTVHVNPEEAVQAALDVGARRILATHYGTFDLADEPVDEPPRRFLAEASLRGLGEDRAWVMPVGETRHW
jgi:N-acyl-phosphatidylethanolamine-hydrolysing phospholipase D